MKVFAFMVFALLSQPCGERDFVEMGVTPRALASICGKVTDLGCARLHDKVCYIYTTNEIYAIWHPEEDESRVYSEEEPIR